LKYALYASDSLSVAEILTLATTRSTAEIIEDRLRYVVALGDAYDEHLWAKDNFYVAKINELREKAREFSASELLNLLIEELDLRRLIMTWGNASQRLDNVDIIRKMALDYEDACNRLQSAASLGGFLLWLDEVSHSGNDAQSSGEQLDAVNVMTYHRSKGLEWPIAICHALENELRDSVWGISIIPEQEEVDLNDLLGKRWLRFWVNPYADQANNTPLLDRIEQSDAKSVVRLAALEEEARLLYVGMTRARDYLVFPSRKNPTKWLNRIWHNAAETPTLDPENQETIWEWNNRFLPIESHIVSYPREIAMFDLEDAPYQYFSERIGRADYPPYRIDLDSEFFASEHQLTVSATHQYAPLVTLPLEYNPALFAKALCYFHASYSTQLSDKEQINVLKAIFKRLGFENIDASAQQARVIAYETLLTRNTRFLNVTKQYPIFIESENREFKTTLDFLAETPQGLLVVQNDNFAGERVREKAQTYLDWAYWVQKSLSQNTLLPKNITFMIHFPFSGMAFEIK
jgi:ATP-dependent exoDNAse (exonuclease V) beta subunit